MKGNVFVVSAPSGGGKTSLVKQLLTMLDNIVVSISHTTRAPRPGEVQGVDYFFVTPAVFEDMIAQHAFVEYAQVFHHYYGTSFAQIQERLQQGIDVVLDIDWQGARQMKALFPEAKNIFILPPSLSILQERLAQRGQDTPETIAYRMQEAQEEMRHYTEFDYMIVNKDFKQAAQYLCDIVRVDRLRVQRTLS